MPIDYSKWDRLEDSSDEEEPLGVQLTRLDEPSRLTRTATGELVVEKNKEGDTSAAAPHASTTTVPVSTQAPPVPSDWTEKGGSTEYLGQPLHWTQDRDSLTIRWKISDSHGWKCQVQGASPERSTAVSSARPRLVCLCDDKGVLDVELSHAVFLGDEDLDWCVERFAGEPFLVFSLEKAVPMAGLTVWWKCPWEGLPEIDLAWRNNSWSEAWEQAHAEFRAKR